MDIGRAWAGARPNRSDSQAAELAGDAAMFGLPPPEPDAPQLVDVWECHRPALSAWLAVSGQWRTAQAGAQGLSRIIWLGLDYAAARAGLDLAGIAVTPDVWAGLRLIEAGAREEMNRGE